LLKVTCGAADERWTHLDPRFPIPTMLQEDGLNYGLLMAAALLAAAPTPNATDIARATPLASNNAAARAASPAVAAAVATPAIGDPAPDFIYQSRDYLWQSLHNMLELGNVLLVFGATDDELRSLERDHEELSGHGVIPVAVVGQREGEVWRIVRRDGLTYSLLADPHAAIAEQYGALDRGTQGSRSLWFVVDRAGRVRGVGEGRSLPDSWTAIATLALGESDVRTAGTR
jgi:peroxiredoxin